MSFISNIFSKSKGLKRYLASLLQAIIPTVAAAPGGAAIAVYLQLAANALGGAGLVHAVEAGTVTKYKLGSLAAVLGGLITAAPHVPALLVILPLLKLIASLVSVLNISQTSAE